MQLTKDRRPVLYPLFVLDHHGVEIPIACLSYNQFISIGQGRGLNPLSFLESLGAASAHEIAEIHKMLAFTFLSLRDVLSHLPLGIHVNLSILYPSAVEERNLGLGSLADINTFADAILTDVFDHARASKEKTPDFMRSIVFTSYNANICTALNWKQPNCEY